MINGVLSGLRGRDGRIVLRTPVYPGGHVASVTSVELKPESASR